MKSTTTSTATLDNLQISFVVTVAGKLKNSFIVQTHCWISSVQHHKSRTEDDDDDDDELLFWTYKTAKTIYTHTHRYMHKQNRIDVKITTQSSSPNPYPIINILFTIVIITPTPPQMAVYTCPTQKRGTNVNIKMGIVINMIPISISVVVYNLSHQCHSFHNLPKTGFETFLN